MESTTKRYKANVRAYPVSDVNAQKGKDNARAYPQSDEYNDKNKHSLTNRQQTIRLATWNLGSLNGRSQELSKTLDRRDINACCIQETKWKGSKSRDIGLGYQLIYYGTCTTRNGVAIALDTHLKQRIIQVNRKNDRLIAVKLAMDKQPPLNLISAYAPQVGCSESEKTQFWEDFDDLINEIPPTETKYIGGDLNGHVGTSNSLYPGVHGSRGYGTKNKQGEEILDFGMRHNLAIINTFFQKKSEHLITYKSSGHSTQIDYILADRNLVGNFKDCKVIPGEALTSQHRILVACLKLPRPIKTIADKTPNIKWGQLYSPKGEELIVALKQYLEQDMNNEYNNNAELMWSNFAHTCKAQSSKILGVSKGKLSNNKDPSWWNDKVKQAIGAKRDLFKLWQKTQLEEDRIEYGKAKQLAKREVAQSRAQSKESFYSRLEDAKNDTEIFKIAKQRHKSTLDIKVNKYIRDKNGRLLTSNEDINQRWCQYYAELLNEEFPSQQQPIIKSTAGPVLEVKVEEVKTAVSAMKNHKAVGPDEIPSDIWKQIGPVGLEWLTGLFNAVLNSNIIPESWRQSYIVPFYKNKGDVSACGNYRAIKLTSHTLKIWERILNNRFLNHVVISENQYGFTPSKSTTDAIQTVRIIMEKHRANSENLHLVFIDLEKAFDRVPRNLVWQAMRAQGLPEYYVALVQDMYHRSSTKVRSLAGMSKAFEVKVGVHQGSALSPLLFNLVMDYLTKDIQASLPWCMLYADDIVLIDKSAQQLQMSLEQWRHALESNGLRISRSKTEHLECNFGGDTTITNTIYIEGDPLPKVSQFKYLGAMLTADGNIETDVTHRVNVAWQRWRALSGVLCDTRMPIQVKGKIYKTAVRPAMMYGAECWAIKRVHEQKLHVAEMKMLRWAAGVTRLDKVRNEHIRGSYKVAAITDKLTESRLRWYGHVMRRPENYVVWQALALPNTKKKRGRPQATWWSTVTRDLERAQLTGQTTQDRPSWRIRTRRADPK